jgi:hypothetical protein
MSSSKKSTTSNKQSAKRADAHPPSNGSKKSTHGRELIDAGADKRYVRRDSKTGRFVERANEHMERAWGKIYDRSERTGASKK